MGSLATRSQRDSTACDAVPSANRAYIPDYIGVRQIDWQQKRMALDSSLQWRPNDKWEFTAEVFYSKADPQDIEHTLPVVPEPENYLAEGSYTATYNSANVWTGGTYNDISTGGIDTRIGTHHDMNGDYSLNAKFNPNDRWAFTADVQYEESRATNYSMTAFTDMRNPMDGSDAGNTPNYASYPGENFTIATHGSGVPTFSFSDPAAMAVATNYYYGAAMDHLENNFAHSWAYRADGTYTFENNSWLKTIDFGFRGEDKQALTRQTGYNWSILSHQGWGNGPTQFLDSTGYNSTHQNAGLPNQVSLFNFGSFFGKTGPSAWFINSSLLQTPTSNIYSYLKDTEAGGWGWTPYNWNYSTNAPLCAGSDVKCAAIYAGSAHGESDNISAGTNNQKETTYAGYVQFDYQHDNFLGTGIPVDGNLGVRVIQTTDDTTDGFTTLPNKPSVCNVTPPAVAPGDCPAVNTFLGSGGSLNRPALSNNYTDVLPSFNFRAHLTDQVQARLAFSQGIVRPDFSYTQNYNSLGIGVGADGMFSSASPQPALTSTAGNPDLKPMHANNYDASLEWYFAPTGSLTFAVFHKDLSDYFLTGSYPISVTNNGVTETFVETSYVNGSKGKVSGFELAYQQYFDSLPGALGGIGFQGNYTKIYNSGGANPTVDLFEGPQLANARRPLPLEGMSPDSYNLALLYSKYGIDARLAYNWRSSFLLTSSAANVKQPVWSENYGQLDGSVFYSFMDHYKIGLQATNILKTNTILDVGYTDFHPRYDWIQSDRKISIVLRANW